MRVSMGSTRKEKKLGLEENVRDSKVHQKAMSGQTSIKPSRRDHGEVDK
jgi:hypothetical protein